VVLAEVLPLPQARLDEVLVLLLTWAVGDVVLVSLTLITVGTTTLVLLLPDTAAVGVAVVQAASTITQTTMTMLKIVFRFIVSPFINKDKWEYSASIFEWYEEDVSSL
jgi:hypothetical protein